jgi:SMC interacting uncharacterized protein involved in chromosome segregation
MNLFKFLKRKEDLPEEIQDAREALTRLKEALSEIESEDYESSQRSLKIARSKVHDGGMDKKLANAHEALNKKNSGKAKGSIKKVMKHVRKIAKQDI